MEDDILTTAQAAKLLGISVRTAQLLIEGGSLASWKTPGGHRRVRRADVLAFIAHTNPGPVFASALVILLAAPGRAAALGAIAEDVGGCTVDTYTDVFAATFAIGSRLPAAVVVDLETDGTPACAARRALLARLAANPALGRTRLIGVGGAEGAETARLVEMLRTALAESGAPVPVPAGADFPVAENEGLRLAALERAGIVDTPPEEAFDRLAWLASRGLNAPVALLTVLTPARQWFKARHGLDIAETPRGWAFCNHTILQRGVFTVENLAADARFAANPAVSGGPGFRFYAGAPVLDADGFALGSLCVMDYAPRTLGADERQTLLALAGAAAAEFRLRSANRQLRWALDTLNRQRKG